MFGWDHVAQGIVQLGFYLMDTFGSKNNGMDVLFKTRVGVFYQT
jgi:hypothetical protein